VFLLLTLSIIGCGRGRLVDDDGSYPALFPKTPLAEAECLEDQDCITTHLKDGECCPGPPHEAVNLYSKDQYGQLLTHQAQICEEEKDYTCPTYAPPNHIEFIYKGQCVQQRCVRAKVPADAPGTPPAPAPQDEQKPSDPPASDKTPTAASPDR
jgi:hypothetical protein